RINPQEIEDTLMETELVTEAAVLGIPDALLGHKLIAIVTPKNSDCSKKLILRECAKRVPRYKLPSQFKLVQSLPKSAIGKIDRTKCLKLITQ
ncbi:MAG: acyl--CoA ligase, partial [Desulfobacterales bacterium]|nr:acyl--CoA ligase [Desulfobacterales bacterium]